MAPVCHLNFISKTHFFEILGEYFGVGEIQVGDTTIHRIHTIYYMYSLYIIHISTVYYSIL